MTDQATIDITTEQAIDQAIERAPLENMMSVWLTALDSVESRLHTGIIVADVGCGVGASTVTMARVYPESTFVGWDRHAGSINLARTRAEDAGVAHRVRFELASAAGFVGGPYDLVTTFGGLRDLGDPVGTAVHVRDQLADDGIWLVVDLGTRAGEHAIRRAATEAGFTHLRRAAETPFHVVYDVRA